MDIPQNIKSAFPNEVDLAREVPDYGSMDAATPSKPKKMRKDYPSLYISGVEGLESMPKEGWALIYYKRRRLSLEENKDGDETSGADLEIQEICLPKPSAEENSKDMKDAFAEYAAKKGVKDSGYEGDDDEESASEDDGEDGEE